MKRTLFVSLSTAISTALAAALLSVSPISLAADNPIVIKFSHVVAPGTPKGKGADRFKELAERYTEGKVTVEVYPNSQLYKDKEEMEALQLGAVQMLAPSLAKFGPLGAREFEAFDLPYIFQNKDDLRKITDGEVGKRLLGLLESRGITGLAYWDNGFKIMSANRPLHTPDDFLGLKMRIQSSKVLEAEMKALDAVPQVMACKPGWSMARKTRRRTCTPRKCMKSNATPRCRTTAIWVTPSSSTRSSGMACPPTCAPIWIAPCAKPRNT